MRRPRHVVDGRQQRMTELLQTHGYIPISDLCKLLSVSEATVRRDLASLSRAKRITRTYGGALADFNVRFPSFLERQSSQADGKRQIAQAWRARLQPGLTVFLDSGTTVHHLALALREKPVRPLTVVTNNLPVAGVLSEIEGVSVHLLGGQLLPRQSVLLGEAACRAVAGWSFDVALLSAQGMTREGLWNSTPDIVQFQCTVVRQSARAVFGVDRSKLGHTAPAYLLSWSGVSGLATDASAAELAAAGIRAPVLADEAFPLREVAHKNEIAVDLVPQQPPSPSSSTPADFADEKHLTLPTSLL